MFDQLRARLGRGAALVDRDRALPGRADPVRVAGRHLILPSTPTGPWPEGTEVLYLAMGCFWGSEELYWQQPGVISTAVGYMGGFTPNPTYEEVCSGRTGHTETVLVAYDPAVTSPEALLVPFWENHDPTQGMRQGNDVGSQYRSAIYWTTPGQQEAATRGEKIYQAELDNLQIGAITTEIASAEDAGPFYYAEDYHQQYLAKNPHGYRCHANTGVAFPVAAG
jgi:peptide-methionine (S)-S-oxide reductase